MDPRVLFAVVCFSAVLLVVSYQAITRLSGVEKVGFAWSATAVIVVVALFHTSYISLLVWGWSHAGVKDEQVNFLRTALGRSQHEPCDLRPVRVTDWTGVIRTSIVLSSNSRPFIKFSMGPGLQAQITGWAANNDALSESPVAVAKDLVTDDVIVFSGDVLPSATSCNGDSLASDTAYMYLVQVTKLEKAINHSLPSGIFYFAAWMIVASPAIILVVLGRRSRTQNETLSHQKPPINTVVVDSVIPIGQTRANLLDLIAEYDRHIAAGDVEAAELLALDLRASQPTTEREWRSMLALFSKRGELAICEIVTERYRLVDPNNVNVIIELLRLIGRDARRARDMQAGSYKRVAHLVDILAAEQGLSERETILILNVMQEVGQKDRALAICEDYLKRQPTSMEVRKTYIRLLTGEKRLKLARHEVKVFRARSGELPALLFLTAELAIKLGEKDLAADCCRSAVRSLRPQELPFVSRVVASFAAVGEAFLLEDCLTKMPLDQFSDATALRGLLDVSEGCGLLPLALSVCCRLLEIAPVSDDLLRRKSFLMASNKRYSGAV